MAVPLSGTGWAGHSAPSLADIEALARVAFAALPESFRVLCGGVVFQVTDFATDDVLDELGIKDPFELMGLFEGLSLPERGAFDVTGQTPNLIFLYRRPMLDYWAAGEDRLQTIVSHVLVHEIGHQMGLSDADMEALEAEASREEDGGAI